MRGDLIYKILRMLGNEMLDNLFFLEAILVSGYGASGSKIQKEYSRIQNKRINSETNKSNVVRLKKYLSKLKSDGLILENSSNKLYLSGKGKKKLHDFQNSFFLNKDLYKAKEGGKVVMVSYDIPVPFNKERDILRNMLRALDFRLVHKSVWVGKMALSERFIADLNRMGIIDYVEILEVTKDGTLKKQE